MKTREQMGRMDRAMRRSGERLVVGADDAFVSPWDVRSGDEPRLAEVTPIAEAQVAVREASQPFRGFSEAWLPKLVSEPKADPMLVEQFRQLAATLHHRQTADGIRAVLVTSAEPSEGKSLTAINLALTLASSYGRNALVIDADLRRPSLHEIAQLPNGTGLGDTLKAPVDRKLPTFEAGDRLTIAPAGPPDRDPMTALASPKMQELVAEAAHRFDWVLIDAPPVGPIADATLLAPAADGVLLVVRAGRTHYAGVQKAIEAIGRERVLGVVLNAADPADTAGYRTYYQAYGPAGGEEVKPL